MNNFNLKTIKQEAGKLELLWADGHESKFPILYLRQKCPCVMCKNSETFLNASAEEELPNFENPILSVLKIEQTGNYGLTFFFSDGHDKGIYSYSHLRNICPCQSCRQT